MTDQNLSGREAVRERKAGINTTLGLLTAFETIAIGGKEIAIEAARNVRTLRARGITVRKTIDTLIATRCIRDGLSLLYSDRDFDSFVDHLGLASAMG